MSRLDQIAAEMGFGELPAGWCGAWRDMQTCECDCALGHGLPESVPGLYDLPAESVGPLEQAWAMVRDDASLLDQCRLWHYLIYHLPGDPQENIRTWPLPEKAMGPLAAMFPLVALASGVEHTVAAHRSRGIPMEVTRQTLADVGLWVRKYHQLNGVWGFGELIWLRRHARSEVLALGRLQFEAGRLKWPVCAYRHRTTNELLALREEDPSPGPEWVRILSPGDDMIGVHIPEGPKMLPEECDKSFAQALEGFPKWFAEKRFVAFTCNSWLIDPALRELLPADSNIVGFQQRFHILPHQTGPAQTYDRVFGSAEIDVAAAPRNTALQRAIADHVLSGGEMHCVAGFIPLR